jgi:hypothetical protein
MTMFNDSKYTRWYLELINKRKERNLEICERHHILPKSVFPQFANLGKFPWNGIDLTPKEHFVCHILLTKMFNDETSIMKMNWALHRMAYSSIFNSRLYHNSRIKWSKKISENHHSKRIENWNEKMSQLVLETWEANTERRISTSNRMKEMWINNREFLTQKNKENSKLAFIAFKEKNKFKIEYKGNYYYSWQNLLDETGCSKFLYKKYYMKGIDPSDRIGKDGPLPGTKQSAELIQKRSEGLKRFHSLRKESR